MAMDYQTLADKCRRLQQALPGVDLFYAIKSLPHSKALQTLHQAGIGFDLASPSEIEQVKKKMGGAPRRTIYTHPIKRDADTRKVLRFGCTSFVVDNADEIL
jgi:ornithine decarboxylase